VMVQLPLVPRSSREASIAMLYKHRSSRQSRSNDRV
jgi:hypothetical protein